CGSLRSSPWSLVSPLARWPTPTPSLRMPRPTFTHVNIPTFTDSADTLALPLARKLLVTTIARAIDSSRLIPELLISPTCTLPSTTESSRSSAPPS
ncbi:hypothetical protein N5P37_012208, partial [Trichoderma harzianum]